MEKRQRKFVYDPHSPSQRRADSIARADEEFLARLVQLRRDLGMSQTEVADLLGIRQSSVAAFERPENDPRLSTVRRYAHAIGVYIEHEVEVDEEHWGTRAATVTSPRRIGEASWTSDLRAVVRAPVRSNFEAKQVPVASKRADFALSA